MTTNFGIVYVAMGIKCQNELIESIKSVRKIYNNIPIKVFSDCKSEIPEVNQQIYCTYSDDLFLDKVTYISQTDFEQTLFLDTDTILVSPVDDAIILLNQFDMMFCHAPFRKTGFTTDIPDAFSEINTGVIFYRNNPKTQQFFNTWLTTYKDNLKNRSTLGYFNDQTSFMQCLYVSDMRYYILPNEFNLRIIFPFFVGGKSSIRILHGTGPQLKKAKQISIKKENIRLFNL